MAVSKTTSDEFDQAKIGFDEATIALSSAKSRFIEAQERFNRASKAWEREFFADTPIRAGEVPPNTHNRRE